MKVHVPTPLHDYTGQRAIVEAEGATLREVLDDLEQAFMSGPLYAEDDDERTGARPRRPGCRAARFEPG